MLNSMSLQNKIISVCKREYEQNRISMQLRFQMWNLSVHIWNSERSLILSSSWTQEKAL